MRFTLILSVACMAAAPATAADYRGASYYGAPPAFAGIRPAPPVYLMTAPPHYVQDIRTGQPGRWVVLQPTFLDRLFGERNGYGY